MIDSNFQGVNTVVVAFLAKHILMTSNQGRAYIHAARCSFSYWG